ncbi:hypothetical protein PC116_g8035 [Phytophthora cactorum]|uniref:Uncharacterized protein n=1 Tax=Phytophthora cactorum TaxID=29920 RepID=A0A8T1GC27_9STRA|nr:hypothetical protein PC111_g10859 [Phytophthora cactorum]KAG2835168.1 hypothetical protein PC112_g5775 [Phytophthora cactorum]KAG2863409.1 hypothetical protein PC113_g5451 [Phytophthora cactorum]KAG2901459.1 hypothetical protein PC114_g13142 [Phytophthora cactorum]KAG2915366.1 hypothetical protein PC115_g11388 [Phytophthora cactorum]
MQLNKTNHLHQIFSFAYASSRSSYHRHHRSQPPWRPAPPPNSLASSTSVQEGDCVLTMSGPRAGSIPEDDPLRGMVMFLTGELLKGPRKGIAKRFQFKLSEGFAVTRAKIFQLMTEAEFGRNPEVIEDENIFFKGTKNARQQDFKALSTTNFGELLRRRWACITEVFVYLAPVAKPTDGIRRAAADRVKAPATESEALQA